MENGFAHLGERVRLNDGRTAVFELKKKTQPKRAGGTARHEARHAVAAELNGTRVVYASVVPGPGYLGITELSGFDAAAAAAPHAHGDSGTGHDVSIIERAGESVGAAAAAARSILSGRENEVEAVADGLDTSGTLGGEAIRHLMKTAGGAELVMRIISPGGAEETETLHNAHANDNGFVRIPIELPKAA